MLFSTLPVTVCLSLFPNRIYFFILLPSSGPFHITFLNFNFLFILVLLRRFNCYFVLLLVISVRTYIDYVFFSLSRIRLRCGKRRTSAFMCAFVCGIQHFFCSNEIKLTIMFYSKWLLLEWQLLYNFAYT